MNAAYALGIVLAATWGAPQAQNLNDPTRPPGISPTGERAALDAEAPAPGPQLQSILISPHRKVAVISGQTVPLGGRFGDATLLTISATAVTLQRGAQRQTLRLLPEVEKKASTRRQAEGDIR
jgi:MSHA biogenesis protein MshK